MILCCIMVMHKGIWYYYYYYGYEIWDLCGYTLLIVPPLGSIWNG